MAVYIINGVEVTVVDLGFVDAESQVYGVGVPAQYDLGFIGDESAQVYAVQYLELGTEAGIVSLAEVPNQADVFAPLFVIIPARSYRRIQLEGGGRQLFESVIGDERIERFFELHKNGRRFPLTSASNPIFRWISPTGAVGQEVARIIDPYLGRVGVHLFEPTETGVWLIQVRYVDDINFDVSPAGPDLTPPYAPSPGAQEFWRQLPHALKCIVRDEGGW